jgi:hypothetical protein
MYVDRSCNSGDRNVIRKQADRILEYKYLTTEIQRTWKVKTKTIPVIMWPTKIISKSLRKYLSSITGRFEIRELQNTDIFGTEHIVRKVLM